MHNLNVSIRGESVTLQELQDDVKAAKQKGLGGKFAFTPETVQALIDLANDLQTSLESVI